MIRQNIYVIPYLQTATSHKNGLLPKNGLHTNKEIKYILLPTSVTFSAITVNYIALTMVLDFSYHILNPCAISSVYAEEKTMAEYHPYFTLKPFDVMFKNYMLID